MTLRRKTPLRRRTPLSPKRKRKRVLKPERVVDEAHLRRVRALGCIVCWLRGLGWIRAESHHPKDETGAGEKAGDDEAIPLCPRHHRTGGFGVAFHAGSTEFRKRYGSERELLRLTRLRLHYQEDPT